MIVFHEGLPGSGKSYESLVRRIIPDLKKGREVQAFVEGLDHEKIAPLAGITAERCRELLQQIDRDEVPKLPTWAKKNALIVLDEAANFWGNKDRMPKETEVWIKEHRHFGNDVILMDQDLRDMHAIWRRRVEFKVCFLKLSGLGVSTRYSVTTYRHKGGDQFEKMGTQVCKYEAQYFGTYASHAASDVKTDDYKDDRANLFKTGAFRYGVPLMIAVAGVGAYKAWAFFQPETHAMTSNPAAVQPTGMAPVAVAPVGVGSTAQTHVQVVDTRSPQEVRFSDLSGKYRIRLAGLISTPTRVQGVVEWVDGGTRVVERMSLDVLRNLGVAVAAGDGFVRLALGGWNDIATMWPLEGDIRVSQARQDALRPAQGPSGEGGVREAGIGATVTRIGGDSRPAAPLTREPDRAATPPKS